MALGVLSSGRWLAVSAISVATLVAVAGTASADSTQAAHPRVGAGTAVPHGWRVIRVFKAKNATLAAIAAPPKGAGWAGGISGTQMPVLYHLTGTFAPDVLPGQLGSFIQQLSATSATNVWASVANQPVVVSLGKHGWITHSLAIGTDDILMSGIVTFGPKNTWVLDEDFNTRANYAYHFNGSTWKQTMLPAAADANSDEGLVSGTSSGNIWALTFRNGRFASMRYNGHKWQFFTFPGNIVPKGQTESVKEILAESPTNVWVTIGTGPSKGGAGPVVLLRFTGTRWRKITGKLPAGGLTGPIASDGAGGVWLAAQNRAATAPLFLHYSRSGKWTTYKVPTADGKILGLTALAHVPGTADLLATATIAPGPLGTTDGTAVLAYRP